MNWTEITLRCAVDAEEIASEWLREMGSESLVIQDARDVESLREDDADFDGLTDPQPQESLQGIVVIQAFFEGDCRDEKQRDLIRRQREMVARDSKFAEITFDTCLIEDQDWNQTFKSSIKAFRIGERFWIRPTWDEGEVDPSDLLITIDPGMAFGTGTHETTTLCIEGLEKTLKAGDCVLDMGTGTGILSIAACRLGASRVVGIDIDEKAIQIARENSEANGVLERVVITSQPVSEAIQEPVDGIVVNIVAEVIETVLDEMDQALRPGGWIVASGILATKRERMLNLWKAKGMTLIGGRIMGEWCSLILRKE